MDKISITGMSYEDRVRLLKDLINSFNCVTVTASYGASEDIFGKNIIRHGSNGVIIKTEICTG